MCRRIPAAVKNRCGHPHDNDTKEIPMSLKVNRREFIMLGSFGIGIGLTGELRAADAPLQNIASRGQVPNQTIAANGAKTRWKGVEVYTVASGGAKSLAPAFCNFGIVNLAVREVDGTAAYTIRKAALTYNSVTVPLYFKGSRSVTVTPGAVAIVPTPVGPSDFGVSSFASGGQVYLRYSVDLPASGNIPSKVPYYLANEVSYLYDPSNEVDDVDSTSGMAAPAGADLWAFYPGSVMMLGQPVQSVTSVIGLGDSIGDGSVDTSGDGAAGGGWMRRAAYVAGLPYLSITRSGDKAQYIAGDNAKTKELIKKAGGDAALIQLGNNDVRDGRTFTQFKTDLETVYVMLRAAGISRIGQVQFTAETSSTDQTTSLSGQTVVSGFGASSVQAQANAWIAGLADGLIDDQIDAPSTVQSDYKWNVPVFSSTLAAAATAYSGSVSLNHAPTVGTFLSFEPGTPANQDVTYFHVTGVSGSGPYTASLTYGPTKAHASGTAVKASLSGDGIHPQLNAHSRIAAKSAPVLQRIKAVKTPWLNQTNSMEIDFVNRRAQAGGLIVPLMSLVSCTRASSGKAHDGFSWFDFGSDQLRSVDGGGLYVEPASANGLVYSGWSGAGGSSLPNGWECINRGLTATYQTFNENGLKVLRVNLSGTATSSGSLILRALPGNWPAAVSGETWIGSVYIRRPGNPAQNLVIQGAIEEMSSSGSLLTGSYPAGSTPSEWARFMLSRTFSNASAAYARLGVIVGGSAVSGTTYDVSTDIAFPMLEKATAASSPIVSSGAAATRAADSVTIALPSGTHNLTFTFDDNTEQTVTGLSGNYTIPTTLNRAIIRRIAAVAV